MTRGPGKYDDTLSEVVKSTGARGGLLFIVEGEHGYGFEVQMELADLLNLPALLRKVADKMDQDIKRLMD